MSSRSGSRDVERTVRADGSTSIRNREPLGAYARCIPEFLVRYAAEAPDRTFLAERGSDGEWMRVTYREALAQVRAIAAALAGRGLSDELPIVILSDNGIDHALLGLAAQYAGILYAPISPAYSLLATDFAKLRAIVDLLRPGLIYAADGERYARAIDAVLDPGIELVVSARAAAWPRRHPVFGAARDAGDVRRRRALRCASVRYVAKILFTSGSTGAAKGVINTQRMLCSNVQMDLQAHPFLATMPPVIVDWLPWNHTFGGNHNFNEVLGNGGTLYINRGKPVPGAFEETIRNLDDVQPNLHYDVPKGYELLADALRADRRFRHRFFARVQMLMYAGAALSQHVWDALVELSIEAAGERILTTSSIGSTETAPMATAAPWWGDVSGNIGIPVPGVEMKLVPNGEKLELRFRGPNITPGYWRAPDLTARGVRRRGFLPHRRRAAVRRRPRSGGRFLLRRPHRRRFQARHRDLGELRSVAGARDRALRAALSRRRAHRRESRRGRGDCFPRSCEAARARRRRRGRRRAGDGRRQPGRAARTADEARSSGRERDREREPDRAAAW